MASAKAQGTIKPFLNFNADEDAQKLHKAMKGIGTDKRAIIDILCQRTNQERQHIARAYKTIDGKDLIEQLKKELSGDFEHLIVALMEAPAIYDAHEMHKAIQGLGTKESVLIEIMSSRSNEEIRTLKLAYKRLYDTDLEIDLIEDTSGFFRQLLVMQCKAERDESDHVDVNQARKDAGKLFKAGIQRFGTDAAVFFEIMAKQNVAQLRAVFKEFETLACHSICEDIEIDFSGSFPLSFVHSVKETTEVHSTNTRPIGDPLHGIPEDFTKPMTMGSSTHGTEKSKLWVSTPNDIKLGLLALVNCAVNQPRFFAESLHTTMEGLGTSDNDLIRIVVTRCEVDMVQIKKEFESLYKMTLEERIKKDCHGSYASGLITLVKGN